MKKNIKRAITLILSVIMVIMCFPQIAFANDTENEYKNIGNEGQAYSTDVSYTMPDIYTVAIPTEIVVGGETEIYIVDNNIQEGKTVTVSLEGLNEDGLIELSNEYVPEEKVIAYFNVGEYREMAHNGSVIGTFDLNTDINNTEFIIESVVDYSNSSHKAGRYTGTIGFSVICE